MPVTFKEPRIELQRTTREPNSSEPTVFALVFNNATEKLEVWKVLSDKLGNDFAAPVEDKTLLVEYLLVNYFRALKRNQDELGKYMRSMLTTGGKTKVEIDGVQLEQLQQMLLGYATLSMPPAVGFAK